MPRRQKPDLPVPSGPEFTRAVLRYAEQTLEDPVPPCDGGIIIARHATWTCLGTWCLIDYITWQCPDGSTMKRSQLIHDSKQSCKA